jgi:Spy/CpxP family protein refolding chaperone
MHCRAAIAFLALTLATPALAQHAQPYAGLQARAVKSLSPEQIADLKAGRGMGLALAAELNGYPGPSHVLELADRLALSDVQRARTQALFAAMQAETAPLGERLIAQEAALDEQFAGRTITPASLDAATTAIGATQARLRATHLKYHLTMLDVLTPEQVRRYAELRGYAGGGETPPHRHSHPR